jgi:hypothetical protein
MNNQLGVDDSLRITRPYVMQSPDDDTAGKHRSSGPVATGRPDSVQVPRHARPVTSTDLTVAYKVALDLHADRGSVQAAFDLIAEHLLTSEP